MTPPLVTAAPRVIQQGGELRAAVRAAQRDGLVVGFVPTMGALHQGHLSLVEAARAECGVVVASVFVNPTQFAPSEDFQKYPRNLDRDRALLATAGCDLLFAPATDEMYPPGCETTVDVGPDGQTLEGAERPTHFRGVATVVMKLFQLAPADVAYFGQKDYQQAIVLRQMVRDLNVPIELRVCPVVRDDDGLPLSSRNAYLSEDERRRAAALPASLRRAERLFAEGERDAEALRRAAAGVLADAELEPDYIALLRDGTVDPVERVDGPTVIAIAARVGQTRLLDNTRIG